MARRRFSSITKRAEKFARVRCERYWPNYATVLFKLVAFRADQALRSNRILEPRPPASLTPGPFASV